MITYGWLWHASNVVLGVGKANPEGSAWQFLSSLLLSAFTLEAYLNHVGAALIPDWAVLERTLSPEDKLERIATELNIDLGPAGRQPLQTVKALVRLRNEVAHGRSETVKDERVFASPEAYASEPMAAGPHASWEARIQDRKFAERVRVDLHKIFQAIHEARPDPKERLYSTGLAVGGASLFPPD